MTPFKIVYGRDPPPLLRHTSSEDTLVDVHKLLAQRDEVLTILKQNLAKAQTRMKHYADLKRSEQSFQVGDWVLVKLQPYRQHSVQLRRYQKLVLVYFGPFQVAAKIGSVAYRLALPSHARIHPVFHVSLLKKFHGTEPANSYLPLPLSSLPEGPLSQPTAALKRRVVHQGNTSRTQVLVQWDGGLTPTWEDNEVLHDQYPGLALEDKVPSNGGGNVTDLNPRGIGPAKEEEGPN